MFNKKILFLRYLSFSNVAYAQIARRGVCDEDELTWILQYLPVD